MFNMGMKEEEDNKIQIFINKKEMLYSHQNMARAINSFLPYLTNNDLTELGQDILDLMDHREKKEAESKLEVEKHSWPYPDTKSNDTNREQFMGLCTRTNRKRNKFSI